MSGAKAWIGAACWVLLATGGCASRRSPEPVIRSFPTFLPAPVSCVPESLEPEPAYPDTDDAIRATAGAGELLQLLAAGRLLRLQRLSEVEPVIAGCRAGD